MRTFIPRAIRTSRVPSAAVSEVLQFVLTLLVGVVTGILSGMFGIGGAIVSTPARRAASMSYGVSPIMTASEGSRPSCFSAA